MNAVETANLNIETMKIMKEASDAMKSMTKRVGINDVDETMCVQPSSAKGEGQQLTTATFTGTRFAKASNSTRKCQKPYPASKSRTHKTKRSSTPCLQIWSSRNWTL